MSQNLSIDFSEFIDIFGNGYRTMPNFQKLDKDEKSTLDKRSFCRELLRNITSNVYLVDMKDGTKLGNPYNLSAFEALYRNHEKRSLHPIASRIVNCHCVNKEKFLTFLSQYSDHYSKEQLLANLQKYFPDATEKTCFEIIANEFVRIIENAANQNAKSKFLDPVEDTSASSQLHTTQVQSFRISKSEIAELMNCYTRIHENLSDVKWLIKAILNYDHQLINEENDDYKEYLNACKAGKIEQWKKSYACLMDCCYSLTKLLDGKEHVDNTFEYLGHFSNLIGAECCQITNISKFSYTVFMAEVEKFEKKFEEFQKHLNEKTLCSTD